ncbi:hypothetical protein Avbf_08433 [Armadillidium vulgare]|nr:hypothetical protein Avbf_08433 [Armadillidium vulgare]
MDVQRGAPNSELSTKLCKAGGQRDATWLSLYCVSTSSPTRKRVRTEGCSSLSFCHSPTLAPEATSLRNLSLTQLFLLAAAARTCREGARTPNSRPSSASQADSGTQLGSPCTASPRPLLLASPSEDSQPRVRCVERKGVCGQKGALVVSFCPSPTLAPEATSLRNLLSGSLSAGGCCTDVQRGPRTPNSRPSSAAGGQRRNLALLLLRLLLTDRGASSEVSRSTVRCVERKGVCGQKGALVSASAPRLRSLRKQPLYETSFLAACLLAAAARTCREGPELRTLDQALQGRRTTGRNFGCSSTASPRPLLPTSPSEIDLRGNLALIASPTRGLGRVSRPPSP